ncbi:MAG TPA: hypothetical protein VGF48_16800 [Thermoanaerobaculia bacterium]|jgi:hypothetical protein
MIDALAIDPYLAKIALAVLAGLLLLFATRRMRWSANRGAAIAAIVYALMIPAMLRTPIDGDEPYYLFITESLVHDRDFDLANQYGASRVTGRNDLGPQMGDPVGEHGEQYSRHEPFLPFLMIPGYLLAGLHGAIATIALFGVLLVRSTLRWLEDEGIDAETSRAVFPFFALAPPLLFYAARIWPEVPAAFFFVEALRGVRAHRAQRWLPAMAGLVLLKLRFVLLVIPLAFALKRRAGIVAVLIAVPAVAIYLTTGVHTWRELLPMEPLGYVRGFLGLLVDGQGGMLFRAPFLLLGVFAITRWKETPQGFRLGILASLLYILYLVPRAEWHGGWSPPLRYIAFLTPVLTLGAAAVWKRISPDVVALIAVWTVGLVIHGVAYPYRLFHIANGENALGEWFSRLYESDFSRLFPSFIRVNDAAWIVSIALIVALLLRGTSRFVIPAAALILAFAFNEGRKPAGVIHFEDAHVRHTAGKLTPDFYTQARFLHRGGWLLHAGEEISFLAAPGTYDLEAITGVGAMIEMAGRAYHLPPTEQYTATRVTVGRGGRVTLRCVSGAVNLDRMSQ